MENLNVLPPKFKNWREFYKSFKDKIPQGEEGDKFEISYSDFAPDLPISKHITTAGFVKARAFEELAKDVLDLDQDQESYQDASYDLYDLRMAVKKIQRTLIEK